MNELALYLTTLQCQHCQRFHTFAQETKRVPVDRDAPWPDVSVCPHCGSDYPDDLAVVITEVAETEPAKSDIHV